MTDIAPFDRKKSNLKVRSVLNKDQKPSQKVGFSKFRDVAVKKVVNLEEDFSESKSENKSKSNWGKTTQKKLGNMDSFSIAHESDFS
jgi:hypothetical protein